MSKTKTGGAFAATLKRQAGQIRADRAQAIAEDAEICFRREVEDIQLKINRLQRERENMLDMSPDNALSLKLATNFDADEFVQKDIALGIQIRNEEIKLEVAKKRYAYLFDDATALVATETEAGE